MEYSLSIEGKNDITYISGSRPMVDKSKLRCTKETQTSGVGGEGEEGERASGGVAGSPKQPAEKDSSASSFLGMFKLGSKLGKALAALL